MSLLLLVPFVPFIIIASMYFKDQKEHRYLHNNTVRAFEDEYASAYMKGYRKGGENNV